MLNSLLEEQVHLIKEQGNQVLSFRNNFGGPALKLIKSEGLDVLLSISSTFEPYTGITSESQNYSLHSPIQLSI